MHIVIVKADHSIVKYCEAQMSNIKELDLVKSHFFVEKTCRPM